MQEPTAPGDLARIHVEGEPQDPVAARVFDKIRARGGPVGTIHRVLAAAPAILEANYDFAITLRRETRTPRDCNELMILRTALREGGDYAFAAHRPMALEAGVSEAQIAALSDWRESDLFDPRQRAVLAYADALADRTETPQAVFDALAARFDAQEIVELTMICGFYVAVARLASGLKMKPGT